MNSQMHYTRAFKETFRVLNLNALKSWLRKNLKEDCAKLVSAKDELEQNHDTLQFELEAQEKKSGSGIKGLQAALS